jgi:hypothetical protein
MKGANLSTRGGGALDFSVPPDSPAHTEASFLAGNIRDRGSAEAPGGARVCSSVSSSADVAQLCMSLGGASKSSGGNPPLPIFGEGISRAGSRSVVSGQVDKFTNRSGPLYPSMRYFHSLALNLNDVRGRSQSIVSG